MKIVVDTYFQRTRDGKRTEVPFEFIDVANAIIRRLNEKLRTYRLETYLEMVRARFLGTELGGFIEFTAITSVHLFDLQAESRFELQAQYGVDKRIRPTDVAEDHAQDMYHNIENVLGSVLTICKRRKLRFVSGHKVVEPV